MANHLKAVAEEIANRVSLTKSQEAKIRRMRMELCDLFGLDRKMGNVAISIK